MSHDLCLFSSFDEFALVGNPDAEDLGLGRTKVFNGNAGSIVEWYTRHCRDLAWPNENWVERLSQPLLNRVVTSDLDTFIATQDSLCPAPEWADQDPVDRHIAMINAFLVFAPGATFGAS